MKYPVVHAIYKHFKGNNYYVICVANHTETGEPFVVYQNLGMPFNVYCRPVEMFMGKTEEGIQRFELIKKL